nr:MAG TPA: hypothetical protein [Caudoviricetes sp.]
MEKPCAACSDWQCNGEATRRMEPQRHGEAPHCVDWHRHRKATDFIKKGDNHHESKNHPIRRSSRQQPQQ